MDELLKEKPAYQGLRLNKHGAKYLLETAEKNTLKELLPGVNINDYHTLAMGLANSIIRNKTKSVDNPKIRYGMPISKEEAKRRTTEIQQVASRIQQGKNKGYQIRNVIYNIEGGKEYVTKFYDPLYAKKYDEVFEKLQKDRLHFEEDKAKTANLLGLYDKPNPKKEKDLISFPSREQELKGLFVSPVPPPGKPTPEQVAAVQRRKTLATAGTRKRRTTRKKTLRRRRA